MVANNIRLLQTHPVLSPDCCSSFVCLNCLLEQTNRQLGHFSLSLYSSIQWRHPLDERGILFLPSQEQYELNSIWDKFGVLSLGGCIRRISLLLYQSLSYVIVEPCGNKNSSTIAANKFTCNNFRLAASIPFQCGVWMPAISGYFWGQTRLLKISH